MKFYRSSEPYFSDYVIINVEVSKSHYEYASGRNLMTSIIFAALLMLLLCTDG